MIATFEYMQVPPPPPPALSLGLKDGKGQGRKDVSSSLESSCKNRQPETRSQFIFLIAVQ